MITSKRQFWDVFFVKLFFNLRAEASKTYLSYFWWLFEPLLYVSVLFIVFGIFMNRGGEDFLLFLVCGQVPFLWFSKSVQNASNSIMVNRSLINQTLVPKVLFPLLTVSQDFVKQSVVFILLFSLLYTVKGEVYFSWIYLPCLLITQVLLIIAVSFFVSAIVPFIPDFRYLVSTGMMLLMFGSGIFYSYKEVLLQEHQELFLLNPIARLIKEYRAVLLYGEAPDLIPLALISALSLVVIFIMLTVFRSFESAFARKVL